jgi:hypothetical protein
VTNSGDNAPVQFDYYHGYPARLRRDERNQRLGGLGCLGPFLLTSLVGVGAAIYGMSENPGWGELLRLAGLAGFIIFFGYGFWDAWNTARHTGIVPYFQQRLGDIHTFASGHAVAKSCQALDEVAVSSGLEPLSAFGFNDDFAGEKLTWHSPHEGLAAVCGLLRALEQGPPPLAGRPQIISELKAIESALQKACDRDIPFCFLLYTAGATNSMEWEQRKGSCF